MSEGLLCPCAHIAHTPRSDRLPLAGARVCSSYSADQVNGGRRCSTCAREHVSAPTRRETPEEEIFRLLRTLASYR